MDGTHRTNHYVTGRDGGRDIGMVLHGRLTAIRDGRLSSGPELRSDLDGADAVAEGIKDLIDAHIHRLPDARPRGVSSQAALYFLGLPWQYTWGSGRFSGVAEHLVGRIVSARRTTAVADGVHWPAGTPTSTFPSDHDDDRFAPRTGA